MKKIIALLLALVMTLSLAACQTPVSNEEPTIGTEPTESEYICSKKIALGYWSILWSGLTAEYSTIEEQLSYVSSLGYDGIELCTIGPEGLDTPGPIAIETGDEEARDSLISLLVENGLECPEYMWLTFNPDYAQAIVDWVDFMNQSPKGAFTDIINIMPPSGDNYTNVNGDMTYEEYVALRKAYVADIQSFADYAAEKGIRIALESEPGEGFTSPTEIVSLAKEINRENVFVQLDLGHTYSMFSLTNKGRHTEEFGIRYDLEFETGVPDLSQATVEEYFAAIHEYVPAGVCGVQIWDNGTDVSDTANASGVHYGLGKGNIDFKQYLTALKVDAQLDSEWLILEFFGTMSQKTAVQNGVTVIKQYLQEYGLYSVTDVPERIMDGERLSLMTFMMDSDIVRKKISVEESLQLAQCEGIPYVDVRVLSKNDIEQYVDAMEATGVKTLCYIATVSFFSNEEEAIKEKLLDHLDTAAKLQAKFFMIVPVEAQTDGTICAEMGRASVQETLKKYYSMAVSLAEDSGIQICFETTPHDFSCLSGTEDCRWLLEQVPDLGLVYDTANMLPHGDDPLEYYEALKQYIVHTHLKDVTLNEPTEMGTQLGAEITADGQIMKCCVSGEGVIPLGEIVKRMNEDGYQGYFALEYCHPKSYPADYAQHTEHLRIHMAFFE